jgi:hypothetical protein
MFTTRLPQNSMRLRAYSFDDVDYNQTPIALTHGRAHFAAKVDMTGCVNQVNSVLAGTCECVRATTHTHTPSARL